MEVETKKVIKNRGEVGWREAKWAPYKRTVQVSRSHELTSYRHREP